MAAPKKRVNRLQPISEIFEHGKIPPQAVDLEEAVLGALMIDNECIGEVGKLLNPAVFYKESHQLIYAAIQTLDRESNPIDILTVTNKLRETNTLEIAGGPFYIAQLTNRVASAVNTEYHVRIILQSYFKREIIRAGSTAVTVAYNDDTDVFESIAQLEEALSNINELVTAGGNMQHISTHADEAERQAVKREERRKKGLTPGIRGGIHELDRATGGWMPNNLIILAARPGMGKTALMLHFAKYAATLGHPVCIYSLEMGGLSLANRMILSFADIDPEAFRNGTMSQYEWEMFRDAKQQLSKLPIYIDDNPICSMRYIKGHSAIMRKKGQCDMIMVDYLQLADMEEDGKEQRNREQDVSATTRQAKIIAKTLNVPFMLLSQLNRAVETRGGAKRPMLSDLRESGAIEQDADIVFFAYRASYYGLDKDEEGNDTSGTGELICAKHRDGATFTAKFKHNPSLTQITDPNPRNETPPVNGYINPVIKNTMQPNAMFDAPDNQRDIDVPF